MSGRGCGQKEMVAVYFLISSDNFLARITEE